MKFRTVCLAVSLVALAAAVTIVRADINQDLKAVLAKIEARAPQIAALKKDGRAGETSQGLIEAVKAVDQNAAKLIAAENADRETFFGLYAKKTKKTAEVVRKNFAVFRFKKAEANEYFKGSNGEWKTKAGNRKNTRQSGAATAERRNPSSPQDAEAELRKLEQRLAEAAAKVAPAGAGPNLIESRIQGEFEGWDGETIFKLVNGQIWQQATYAYTYHYAYQPEVMIIKTHGAYKMKVDGVSGTIFVKRLK
jgi:uncharacterized protein YdbL (DUF1318 family)